MRIQWMGHSSFLIVAADGTKIITDPYKPDAFGGAILYSPIDVSPDVVTISHDHADHNYVQGLPGRPQVIASAGSHIAGKIEFVGVQTSHDPEGGALRGLNLMFVFAADGIRVCHLGDLGAEPNDDQLRQLGSVDVLLIPVGGYYTIDAQQATRTTERIGAKLVIPMHFKTPKVNLPIEGVEPFLAGKEQVLRADGTEIELTADDLPSEQHIVVLKHAR